MVKLIEKGSVDGVDITCGTLTLAGLSLGPIHWIAPYSGQKTSFSKALQEIHGLSFPAPGTQTIGDSLRCVWSGRDQALLIGAAPGASLSVYGAVTDVRDGWAGLALTGQGAGDALARLTPLDLRPAQFASGRTARTLLGHMNAQITATDNGFEILVMSSMAGTAVHELHEAMRSVAARAELAQTALAQTALATSD